MLVASMVQTGDIARTYNLEVADWHTFMVGDDHVVVHNGSPLCARAAALAARLGHNRVSIKGAGGKLYTYDLAGAGHFEKSVKQRLPTPHVRAGEYVTGPNGRVNFRWGPVRDMTEADFRVVEKYLGLR